MSKNLIVKDKKIKLFISCPITKYFHDSTFDNEFKEFIKKVYMIAEQKCEEVYLALEEDNYNINEMTDDSKCIMNDSSALCNSDIVVAIPEDSQGAAVELGWASAKNKKIILIKNFNYKKTAMIDALEMITDVTTIEYIHVASDVSNDNAFFRKLSDEIDVAISKINSEEK